MTMTNSLRRGFQTLSTRPLLVSIVFTLAVLVGYAPSLNGKFLWDDSFLVGKNPFFRSPVFALEVFHQRLYPHSSAPYYRPAQNLSYMFDYWLWHSESFGYHFSNILLHAFSASLLYAVLRRILPPLIAPIRFDAKKSQPIFPQAGVHPEASIQGAAFLIALIWAIHPVHNAAVAYISGRADSLASLFALSGWLLFLKGESFQKPLVRWGAYSAALICSLLALCSKEIALVWMAAFLIWILAFQPKTSLSKKLLVAGFLFFSITFYWFLRHLPKPHPFEASAMCQPFGTRLLLMLRALGDYAGLIFWPANLHMERILGPTDGYRNPSLWAASLLKESLGFTGLLILLAFGFSSLKKWPGQRICIFGVTWFLSGFLPVSNLFPLNAQAAEHWIYMPSIGFLIFLAGLALSLPSRFHLPTAAIVLAAAIPLTARTALRSREWSQPHLLYRQTTSSGGNTARINSNLAAVYMSGLDPEMSEKILRDTMQQFPGYFPARLNFGILLFSQGKEEEAEPYFTMSHAATLLAAEHYPDSWSAPLMLARIRCHQNRPAEALSVLEDAIPIYPEVWELIAAKAEVLQSTSGVSSALPIVQKFADDHWWHLDAHLMLGDLRSSNGEMNAAITAWREAARLDIYNAKPFVRIAHLAFAQNRLPEACEAQRLAIDREPNQPALYLFLASTLEKLGRKEEAEAATRHGEELRRSAFEAHKASGK